MRFQAPAGIAAVTAFSLLLGGGIRRAALAGEETQEEEEGEAVEETEAEEEEGSPTGDDGAGDGADAGTSVKKGDASLEQLIEWNGRQLFGGKVKVNGERFQVHFDATGQVKAGFEGKGILDAKSEEMSGANRRFIRKKKQKEEEKEQLLPGLAAIGMGEGIWQSRFPVAGEPWVEMGFRVPNLIGKESNVRLRVNWNKKSGYETNFFNTAGYVSDGILKGNQVTALKEYQGLAAKWFPRKGEAVKVEFGIRDGRCIARIASKDVAILPKAFDKGGHISLAFSKLLFTVHDLKISGKLDRAWCEKEIEKLRASGKLQTSRGSGENDFGEADAGASGD